MERSRYIRLIDPNLHIADYPGAKEPVLPEPDAGDVAWARENPGKWRYFVDPTADKASLGNANVIGGWQADENGGMRPWLNPDFVPTRRYAKVEIVNELELVLWRMDYGFNNIGHFVDAFSRSEFTLLLSADDPTGERGMPVRPALDGSGGGVELYTSEGHVPHDANPWLRRKAPGAIILEQVSSHDDLDVILNPYSEPHRILDNEPLTRWWQELQDVQRAGNAQAEGRSADEGPTRHQTD